MKNPLLSNIETEQQIHTASFRLKVNKRSDKLINVFLIAYFSVGLLLAFFYDTWQIAFGIGGLSLLAYYSVKKALPDSTLYQYVLSVILGVFMAQFIYQMHGLFEMHFFAFIGSAILITYQNWKLQIPMLLVVVLHHLGFGYLQNTGVESVYFTQLEYFEWQTFIIHFMLAAAIFFICGLWGYQLRKYSEQQISQSIEMAILQKEAIQAMNAQKQQAEHLQAEQALSESNKRFAYAAQATSDAIWDHNYSEDTVFWGEGFHTLFGYEMNEETRSADFWESKVDPDDLKRVSSLKEEAKNNPLEKTWTSEYSFLKANGQYAIVREKAIILRDENGKPIRSIGSLQDITESKQNEFILKRLNENLEKEKYFLDILMDNMPDNIYFKDLESKFLRVSKHMVNKFGTTLSDIIGKSDFDFQVEEKAISAYNDEQIIMETKVPKIDYIEKEKGIGDSGLDNWVLSTKMPLINPRGEVVGTFGISRDITQLKKLEEEQRAAEIDKAVAQGKFEIASDVMHDIGNAVVGFGSYLTRVRRLQDQESPENLQQLATFFEDQKKGIESIIGEAKAEAVVKMLSNIAQTQKKNREVISCSLTEQFNIVTHIQEILDIQRQYISSHQSQERKPVNLRNIINDSLAMVYASIDKLSIDVSINIPAENPIIKGDRTRLMQVMLNIFKNSIEAIDADAEKKTIAVNVNTRSGYLVVEVADSGNGFSKETSDQLFKRGFTTKPSGSGLGLCNCRSIVQSHEGSFVISSDGEGKGSLTTIRFKI